MTTGYRYVRQWKPFRCAFKLVGWCQPVRWKTEQRPDLPSFYPPEMEPAQHIAAAPIRNRAQYAKKSRRWKRKRTDCLYCGEPLPEGVTKRRLFCSDVCRASYARRNSVHVQSVSK